MKKIITKISMFLLIGLTSFMLFACSNNKNNTHLGLWYRYDAGVRSNVSKRLTSYDRWEHTIFGSGNFTVSDNIVYFYAITLIDLQDWSVFRIGTITNDVMYVENTDNDTNFTYKRVSTDYVVFFTMTFDTMGGSYIDPITTEGPAIIQAPIPPTKDGYTFDHWQDENGVKVTFPYLKHANISIYATWIANSDVVHISSCGLIYSIIDNEIWITGANATQTSITIPAYINNFPVRHIADGAFALTKITSIFIPSTIISIGNYAFWNANNLTTVTLNEGLLTIGANTFRYTNMCEIIIPQTLNYIGLDSFDWWVTIIGLAYGTDYLLYEVVNNEIWITGLNTTDTVINIPAFINDMPVTRINDLAFAHANISAVSIPSTVTSIGDGAFAFNLDLKTVILREGLQTIGISAFIESAISELVMPSTVITIGDMAFVWNENLRYLTLNEGLLTIGDFAFVGSAITNLVMPSTLRSIGEQAFARNWVLRNLTLNEGLLTIGAAAFIETAINDLVIPSTITHIGNRAFAFIWRLTNLTLNEGLITIGDEAFIGIPISNLVMPSTVITIGNGAFNSNFNLRYVTLNEGLLTIGDRAFSDTNIIEITIPSTVQHIGFNAFDADVIILLP